ncbi:MAG: nuclear transport factor 2 family protein [Rhodospirillales bacterium]
MSARFKSLKYRYLRGCDRKEPDAVRDCLDPEGAVIAYEGFPRFEDRESFVQVYREMGCRPNIIDMHHGHNPEITLTGPDSATGRWELYFNSIDTDAATVLQMACVYADSYTRRQGRWWISETSTVRTSFLMQQLQPDGTLRVLVMGEPPNVPYGQAPPDR